MIQEVMGDLLTFDANVLCHQTNYCGVMGGGIAASIRQKILTAEQYNEYKDYCMYFGSRALGTVLYSAVVPGQKYIANCFSQRDWTTDNTLTDYDALRVCLSKVESAARAMGWSVALPGYIGCGIAGGDWDVVQGIIRDVFKHSPVMLTIVYWYADQHGKL